MTNKETLSKINVLDRLNASILSFVTPEMGKLRKTRKRTNYPDSPTFAQPVQIPYEKVEIHTHLCQYDCY